MVKDNKLMMEGFRNKEDKLWDIPVHNPDLLKSKNTTISHHAGLYSTSKRIQKMSPAKTALPKVSPKYENIFHTFDDLIDYDECVNHIVNQKKGIPKVCRIIN